MTSSSAVATRVTPCFVVASGRFVAHRTVDPDVPIGFMRAGDVIGERAVISGQPRAATVTATADGKVLRISADGFRRLLTACPRFAAAIEERDAARERHAGGNTPLDFTGELPEDEPADPAGATIDSVPAERAPGRSIRNRNMPVVRQFDAADCGVAALASVARFHGTPVSVTFLRDVAGTEAEGTSLHGLCSAATAIGFDARPVKVSRDRSGDMALPAIIHWEKNHWVVLYRVDGGGAVIGDPAIGLRKVTTEQLRDWWSGYAAVLTPTDALRDAPVDRASLRWVAPLLRPHRILLAGALFLALVSSGLEVLLPVIVGRIVNALGATEHADLVPSVVALSVIVAGTVVVGWSQRKMLAHVAVRFDRDSLDFLTGQLLALPMSYFAKRKVGDIERRLQSMGQVRRIVVQEGVIALSALALVVAVLVAMILEAPLLGVAFLVVLPLYAALMWVSRSRIRPIMAAMEEAMARYAARQVDLLKGVETVKTLGVEPGLRTRMNQEFDKLNGRLASAYSAMSNFGAATQLVNLGVYAFLCRVGGPVRAFRSHHGRHVRRLHRTGAARLHATPRTDVGLGRSPVDLGPPGQTARRARARARTGIRPQRSRTRHLARGSDRGRRGGVPVPGR